MKLSILIPVYNEKDTLKKILKKILAVNLGNLKKEIIIIDDNSHDGTKNLLKNIKSRDIIIFYNKVNQGKGYCIKKAIENSTGDLIIFQDADLEYDPQDYSKMIKMLLDGKRQVVYGSRFLEKNRKGKLSFYLGNRILSILTSIIYLTNITDMETCYKLFRNDILKNLDIKADDFSIEPEITAKILKKGIKIKEVPISYYPRIFEEGKKIRWKDGFIALKTLIYYRIFD